MSTTPPQSPAVVRLPGQKGDQPLRIGSYDVAHYQRLLRDGVPASAAQHAAAVPPGRGRVTLSVQQLNRILAKCTLTPDELGAILGETQPKQEKRT